MSTARTAPAPTLDRLDAEVCRNSDDFFAGRISLDVFRQRNAALHERIAAAGLTEAWCARFRERASAPRLAA